jgi:hypothetical protein
MVSQEDKSSSLKETRKRSRPDTPLAKVIEALIHEGDPISGYERPLRLFQFMYWLIDDAETKESLKESALLFCAIAISQESKKLRKRFTSASGFELLFLTISAPRLRWLINETFARDRRLYDLALIPLVPYDKKLVQKIEREINILNSLTRFQLRLIETVGFEPSLSNSLDLLSTSKNLAEKSSVTVSKNIEQRRRERSAFLYVAAEHGSGAPDIFYIHRDTVDSFLSVESGGDKEIDLRAYFAKVKGILSVVNEPLADKLGAVWPQLDPIPLDPLQPIDPTDLDTAGIKKKLRRSAKETKAGNRQRPGSN